MKKLTKAILGIVVAIIVIFAVVLIYESYQVSTTVDVTAVDISIVYDGTTSGYLGPTSQSQSGFSSTTNSGVVDTITFTSSASFFTHEITSITLDSSSISYGFTITQITPTLPTSFSPGSTVSISVTIDMPSSAYTGILGLVVTTD